MGMDIGKGEEVSNSIKVFLWSDIHKRRIIGEGGQAQVFEAELRPEGRTVAIKEFLKESRAYDNVDDNKATICYEARTMARLQHPNIIQLYGVVADSTDIANARGVCHLVMEFMPSGDLLNVLLEDYDFVLLPWRSRVVIALQVAQALEYMHSIGVIHFDIKSPNVLLDLTDPAHPLCKICDFGVAADKEADLSFADVVVGTAGRMAPEMAFTRIREKITEKADVYSYGVLLKEILTSQMHFGVNYVENNKDVKNVFFWTRQHHNSVPEWCFQEWRKLMRDCLNCKASMRPDFKDVADRLRDMLSSIDSEPMGVDCIVADKASAISDDEDSFWMGYLEDESEEDYEDDESLTEESDCDSDEDDDNEDSEVS